jgi:CCR4-NOT transcriptional complex subunit CAF120
MEKGRKRCGMLVHGGKVAMKRKKKRRTRRTRMPTPTSNHLKNLRVGLIRGRLDQQDNRVTSLLVPLRLWHLKSRTDTLHLVVVHLATYHSYRTVRASLNLVCFTMIIQFVFLICVLGAGDYLGPQAPRFVSDQYSEAGRRSLYPDTARQQASQAQMRQPEFNNVGAARQNMWSQALERDTSAAAPEPTRDTFVQIEPPSQTMTKAFAPHGLLSAGLQDKQDRSAKRQEELARESGASLINVAHKPPPPQTGLLGAVTAHERERKREGGLGATLTEREREKRLAEERQRKLDEYQRMQLDQMQQGGTMYGGMGMQPQFSGFNPMMSPMMMGMNPMMTGGYMGFPGMMNPQHMFAAQQAAQAYQQAMYAFSTAGSQVGGEGGSPGAAMNPMMTGNGMGLDPRMSMMGIGMLSPSMTGMGQGMMSPGMNPMGMGMMGGMGMGPQMTGGSMFDPRFLSGNEAPQPSNEAGGSPRPYSQNSNGQGSPSGPRHVDGSEEPARRGADVR